MHLIQINEFEEILTEDFEIAACCITAWSNKNYLAIFLEQFCGLSHKDGVDIWVSIYYYFGNFYSFVIYR